MLKVNQDQSFHWKWFLLKDKLSFLFGQEVFWKDLIEAQIYAQYPDIEVTEVPNYTSFVKYDPNSLNMWGVEFKLSKDDFYPIKLM